MLHWLRRAFAPSEPDLPEVPAAQWARIEARLPFLDFLDPVDRPTLRELARRFVATKEFHGAHDTALSDDMLLEIALQACLPVLRLGLDWYDDWVGVVVYPGDFIVPRRVTDDADVLLCEDGAPDRHLARSVLRDGAAPVDRHHDGRLVELPARPAREPREVGRRRRERRRERPVPAPGLSVTRRAVAPIELFAGRFVGARVDAGGEHRQEDGGGRTDARGREGASIRGHGGIVRGRGGFRMEPPAALRAASQSRVAAPGQGKKAPARGERSRGGSAEEYDRSQTEAT